MNFSSRYKKLILTGLAIIIFNNLVGYILAPVDLFLSLVLLPLVVGVVNYSLYERHFNKAIFYNYGLLLFNDLLIRILGGRWYNAGYHDDEGKGVVALFFLATFGLSFITMAIVAWQINQSGIPSYLRRLGIIFLAGIGTLTIYLALYYNTQLLPF